MRICWSLDEDELLRIYSYEFWQEGLAEEDRERLKPKLSQGKGVFAPLMMNGESAVDHIADPDDIAEGIVLGVVNREKAVKNIFNLAGPKPFKYLEVIEDLARGMGVPWDSARVKGIEPYELRNDKAKKYLGYEPRYTMKMMIEKAVKRYRKDGKKVNE